ncbi:TIGR03756 family integrating conjugative element protein [Salinisphaera orenii]|uniref:TIGR03756 family integrating conjugative element protein n=1 Tax=Salinisphaera orenii TaxID=856731 RepID=UPI0019550A6E
MSRLRSVLVMAVFTAGVVGAALGPNRPAAAVSTAQLVSSAASQDCLEYQVIGVCVWLTCTPTGCDIDTSVEVKHFMPDLVVSAYLRTGHNPWQAVAGLSSPGSKAESGGNQRRRRHHNHEQERFKSTDAIGDPAAAGFDLLSSFGYSCQSAAEPFEPYYLSIDDPLAWRGGIPESTYPQALTPGVGVIGNPGNKWGHLYPREGIVKQTNDYKAAAVNADRAAHIVTRTGQPHVYNPLTADDRQGYWPPKPFKPGDKTNHKWQRLQPDPSDSCTVFPDRGPAASFKGDIAKDGAYAFVLWRPYACCKQRGEVLIGYTPPDI